MRLINVFAFLLILSACGPSAEKSDPIRIEFAEGCMGMTAYQSMPEDKRNKLCTCIYDNAISGLEEDAQNAARFYLLGQAGVKAASKNLVSQPPDMKVLLEASNAIGNAVKRCR
ncbi:MAG: hypothetical protein AAGA53_12635 [Pseudomonadota bacterium]